MATKANRRMRLSSDDGDESKSSSSSGGSSSPKQWWQWLLLYPSFAVALLTAGPQWYDKISGFRIGVRSAAEAERQAALWQKNASCVGLNSSGYVSPSKVAVDATICNSGDILVRAVTPQKAEIYRWLALDDVVSAKKAGGGFIPSAEAATLPIAQPSLSFAILQTVLCTKSDGRYLTRRVQTSEGCFDEVIDTFTGALVSRTAAPCVPQC